MMKPRKPATSKSKDTKEALLKLQEMRTAGTWVKCTDCLKWRYLPLVQDPAEIKDTWTCQDHPDTSFQHCNVPENLWNPAVNNNMVETRFTVGSIVMAKMDGWPAWPAMVDDDPDIGDFFWTELTGDRWTGTESPTQYHVVFFDTSQVSRAWIRDTNIQKFSTRARQAKVQPSLRLTKSLAEASIAANMSLAARRAKYCFSSRWSGGWGPVWPDYGEEETDVDDGPFSDNDDIDHISQEILSQPDQDRNMSFIDKSFNCDVLSSADNIGIVLADLEKPGPSSAPIVSAKKSNPAARKSKKSSGTALKPFGSKKTNKENVAPKSTTAHLYQNKEVFTEEMSEKVDNKVGHNITFDDEDSRDILNSSLARDVDKALQVANMFTPIKRTQLALGDKPESSPGPSSYLEMTTSTPVRQSVLDKQEDHQELADVTEVVNNDDDDVEANDSIEDPNNNSNAFSHDGSFN